MSLANLTLDQHFRKSSKPILLGKNSISDRGGCRDHPLVHTIQSQFKIKDWMLRFFNLEAHLDRLDLAEGYPRKCHKDEVREKAGKLDLFKVESL